MKRPPGRPKKDSSLAGQLGCGDTEHKKGTGAQLSWGIGT